MRKLDKEINENAKNGLMNFGVDSWFTTTMGVFNVFCVLIPSYSLLLYNLYTTYDP